MIRYGSREWLKRLRAAGYDPVGIAGRMIVVELPWGTRAKVVGGTPESPTLIEITPVDELVSVGATTSTIERTWIDWYNNVAQGRDRDDFDRAAARIDELGVEALPGGSQDDIVESYRYTHPNIYKALINYRDTGGRASWRAEADELQGKTPAAMQYSDQPIAQVQEGGPIEQKGEGVVLHPGRYTYSNVLYDTKLVDHRPDAFPQWLDAAVQANKAQVIRTQVTEGILGDVPVLNIFSTPYHRDYEFLVVEDLPWNTAIHGFPTWLPKGADVQSYWGKPTGHSGPGEGVDALQALLQKLLVIGVLVGGGYLILQIAQEGRRRRQLPA
jgi:hypothetical protein